MKIIVDAMGGDNAPDEIVKGAVTAALEHKIEIILTGRGEDILRAIDKMGLKELPKGVEIVNASEVIEMEDDPATAVRQKKDSSLTVGLTLLRDGRGDALVSAGSTGAVLSGATLIVKRIRGIRRAALAPFIPNSKGGFILIDCGANVECTPEYLLQFAYMGSYYAEGVLGISKPRVGLLNNGTERSKGPELQIATYDLIENAVRDGSLNFIGNVEAKDAMLGACDVLVSDGFSGNVFLKTLEGATLFILEEIKKLYTGGFAAKLSALLIKKRLRGMKSRLHPDKVGGTALLGISKPVIKAHGSSGSVAICNAVLHAVDSVGMNVSEKLQVNIEHMKIDEAE